ncbi:hypothetical protein GGQ92_002275 [Gracilibacillus halotolerans]|uniref:DUF1349 domain-containing protein n=1 Tax=Gracilibacillus halotolerans TaxID=74386 RepID=A0A841RPB2_9BACI|nr:DUF1349 domain-containing protein [Gracilibacillus halotolerans]MBB6513463.1 hypothetical protein [Gracilibacillus halotolerans]
MNNKILDENFDNKSLDSSLKWHSEPSDWYIDEEASQLVVKTTEKTDFWQKTHYGFQADDGHFLFKETKENFRMTTKLKLILKNKYDQAGLMIRFSEDMWIKTSLEYLPDSLSKLGAVVTNQGYSDWSTQLVECEDVVDLYFRVSRIGKNGYVDYSWDGDNWEQMRITHLHIPDDASIQAGVYVCSPQKGGLEVRYDFLTIEKLGNDPDEAYL